jgi:hypothetical protein
MTNLFPGIIKRSHHCAVSVPHPPRIRATPRPFGIRSSHGGQSQSAELSTRHLVLHRPADPDGASDNPGGLAVLACESF